MNTSSANKVQFTYEDYRHTPDDGKRYEIIDGDLCVSLPPPVNHQVIAGNLLFTLAKFLKLHPIGEVILGPLEVYFSKINIAQPDIIFISKARWHIVKPTKVKGAPDLVIEVPSPGTAKRDRTIKAKMYAQFGVREYWLPKEKTATVEIFRLQDRKLVSVARLGKSDVLTSPLFPGLEIRLSEIFDF
jgi:Uma2 family endonuclease